ncbi:hypothetical protein [Vagococcus xieshaowenii]|uniref:Uncharacterized protein n=1 Tax=Vagococcus xieshaowenii TaxID=2562451 RepID=A0AAJ5EDL9_9ENTE|nr:hypothetical protein [Vagococcus xieshaowenii]QCA28020.1 hypothetical protein E4Z98_01125 [Vagococcus xieshaowenii]TFZ40298.1 hypothetical protein E4031_07830 [Vagococcus xieshaowenii]
MKSLTKVLVGGSAITLVGTSAAILASKKVVKRLKGYAKKQELKKFVDDNMAGNKQYREVVDLLTEQEIFNLSEILERVKQRKKNVNVVGPSVSEEKETVKNFLVKFLDTMPIL